MLRRPQQHPLAEGALARQLLLAAAELQRYTAQQRRRVCQLPSATAHQRCRPVPADHSAANNLAAFTQKSQGTGHRRRQARGGAAQPLVLRTRCKQHPVLIPPVRLTVPSRPGLQESRTAPRRAGPRWRRAWLLLRSGGPAPKKPVVCVQWCCQCNSVVTRSTTGFLLMHRSHALAVASGASGGRSFWHDRHLA